MPSQLQNTSFTTHTHTTYITYTMACFANCATEILFLFLQKKTKADFKKTSPQKQNKMSCYNGRNIFFVVFNVTFKIYYDFIRVF